MCVKCLVHSGSSGGGSRDEQQQRSGERWLLTWPYTSSLKHWKPQLRVATYVGDCVSVEFCHGLDAFERCHQFIITFHINDCLQGTEEMAC